MRAINGAILLAQIVNLREFDTRWSMLFGIIHTKFLEESTEGL